MDTPNQLNLKSVVRTYQYALLVCVILLGIEFEYIVEIGSFTFLGFKVDVPIVYIIYGLSFVLLLFNIQFYYFRPGANEKYSELIYTLFLALSLFVQSISIPPDYHSNISQNLVMAGYFFVALFWVHKVINEIFDVENYVLTKEKSSAFEIRRFNIFALLGVGVVFVCFLILGIIVSLCFTYANDKVNENGLYYIAVSAVCGVLVRFYVRGISKNEIALMQRHTYNLCMLMYVNNPENEKECMGNIGNDFSTSNELQDAISASLSGGYEERVDFDEEYSALLVNVDEKEKKISLKLRNKEKSIEIKRSFLAFPYSLPFYTIKERMENGDVTDADLLSVFEYVVDKDMLTKSKLYNIINKAKKKENYAGIWVKKQDNCKESSFNNSNHLAINVYTSFKYFVHLSKLNEHCSAFFAKNPELNIEDSMEFSVMFRYALGKCLDELIIAEEDRMSGYELAEMAVNLGSLNKLKTAIEIDLVDVNAKSKETEWTLLCYSVANKHYELAKYLLENKADPNIPNYAGRFPIHFSCRYNNVPMVELLIAYGANIEEKDDKGNTPIIVSIMHGNKDTLEFLLARNANIYAVGGNGITAIELARRTDIKMLILITQSKQYNK